MLDYSTIANTTGSFPNVVSNNVSAPGAADGTPVVKNWVDQTWGAFQALLNKAGLSPNAVTESPSNSQIFSAVQRLASHPGEIITWCGQESDPSVLGIRALALQGQGILRANYSDLDTAIYCGNSNNATADSCYRADDAAGTSRNTSGIYLILPDMRGRFLRGLDLAGTRDFEGASRIVGNYQDSLVGSHYHYVKNLAGNFFIGGFSSLWPVTTGASSLYELLGIRSSYGGSTYGMLAAENNSIDDNVPYNMAINYWIRY